MRIVFAWPFSFMPASRMLEPLDDLPRQLIAHLGAGLNKTEIASLRHRETGEAAGVDGAERRKVHLDVEREAVIGAAAHHADTERGQLGRADIDARGAGAALGARPDQVDDGLLQQPDVGLYLHPAAR